MCIISFFQLWNEKKFHLSKQKMDVNGDGVVTLEEFIDCCKNDEVISKSISVFDMSIWPEADDRETANGRQQRRYAADTSTATTSQVNPSTSRSTRRSNVHRNHHSRLHDHANVLDQTNQRYQYNHHYYYQYGNSVQSQKQLQPISHLPNQNSMVHIESNHPGQHHHHHHHHYYHLPPPNYHGTEDNANGNSNDQLQLHVPDSPSLVKVKTWYTVSKQGVC